MSQNNNNDYEIDGIIYSSEYWVKCDDAEFLTAKPFKAFCLKKDGLACLNLVRNFTNIGQFYCDAEEFEKACADKHEIVMKGVDKEIKIVPSGYQTFQNLINISDLKNTGIL